MIILIQNPCDNSKLNESFQYFNKCLNETFCSEVLWRVSACHYNAICTDLNKEKSLGYANQPKDKGYLQGKY
jgi:hypothetical protein